MAQKVLEFMTRLRIFTFNAVLICIFEWFISFSSLPAEKASFAVDDNSAVLDDDSSVADDDTLVAELDSSMIEEERLAAEDRN